MRLTVTRSKLDAVHGDGAARLRIDKKAVDFMP